MYHVWPFCADSSVLFCDREAVAWAEKGPLELDARLQTRMEVQIMVSSNQCHSHPFAEQLAWFPDTLGV